MSDGVSQAVWLKPVRSGLRRLAGWLGELTGPAHPPALWASIRLRPAPWMVALASTAAVTAAFMPTIDASSIMAARTLPRWIIDAFRFYTDFGKSGWFLWPLGIVLLLIALTPTEGMARWSRGLAAAFAVRFGFLFVAIGLPSLFGTIVKRIIGRARPFVGGAADPYLYSFMAFDVRYASFPSGHSTTGFAVAIAIGALWPRTRIVMWTYAVLMAISRVVVTAHHPSDVAAGAVVGIIGAMLVRQWFALKGLGFDLMPDGSIRPRPVPSWASLGRVASAVASQWRKLARR